MRTWLAYRPRRAPLQSAEAPAALAYLGALALVAFVFESPLVLAAAAVAVALVALAAGAPGALRLSLRWGLPAALLITAINPVVTSRGLTVLVRGPEAPVLGALDITLEALAAGAVLGLRVLVVMMVFCVYSSCVDPDRVLRMLRPLARRSALTATLIARMVPVAAADAARLREAAALRGPGAAAVGRTAMVRRLVAGSLDRAVDVAATLELRGYGGEAGRPERAVRRSRYDRAFLAVGLAIAGGSAAARLLGAGEFEAYPTLALDAGPATLALACALPVLALAPFLRPRRGRHARRLAHA